ncbi:uncharacterized protein VTP21DRAFT_778 [Calcarisporiella thermophila]|uniref:uncharacterized protein n=1 Tax=Calcarisporiella thermophila TaxID=911321 RepID=UPI0037448B5B
MSAISIAWENFLEVLAQLISKALTDKEKEVVLAGFTKFGERIRQLSSQSLRRLALEPLNGDESKEKLCHHDGKTCAQNATRGFLKSFTVAYIVKYLISIAPALLTGRLFKKPYYLKKAGGKDTVSFAIFLSSFITTYKASLCAIRHLRNVKGGDGLNAFIAGSLAGLTLLLERNKGRRLAIMLYLVTRSAQFGCAWLMQQWASYRKKKREQKEGAPPKTWIQYIREEWDEILSQKLEQWSGALVFIAANSQIIYSFVFKPETLPRSYYSFLLNHSGFRDFGAMGPHLINAVSTYVDQFGHLPDAIKFPEGVTPREYIAANFSPNIATAIPKGATHEFIPCAMHHPLSSTCTGSMVRSMKHEFRRSLRLYLPLNLLMTLIFRWKQITKRPDYVFERFMKSTLRSSIFLTAYVTLGFSAPCAFRHLTHRDYKFVYLLAGMVGGSSVLLEAPGRRLELGLYCLPRALESLWKSVVEAGWARNVKNGDVALFSIAMGVLMSLYQNNPSVINTHYLAVLTRFFGKN